MNNYYDILGVREDSTSEEIKKAYRKLSKEHHPDMGGDPEKFKNLSEAYGILSDTQKRNNYDNRRKNPFFGSGVDTDQIFEQFFARGGQGQNTNVENLNANVEVTLEEINEGVKKTIRFNRVVIDRDKKMSVCPSCGGRGTINLMGPFKTRCGKCNGSGRIHQYKKVVTEVNFDVAKGTKDGETIFYPGFGNETPKGPGNLFIKLKQKPHPHFIREGNNIITKKEIPFPTMILGGEIEVPTLTGKIMVKVSEYTKPKQRLRVAGKGLSSEGGYSVGDLIIELNPTTPSKVTKEERKLLEELKLSENFNNIKY